MGQQLVMLFAGSTCPSDSVKNNAGIAVGRGDAFWRPDAAGIKLMLVEVVNR